MGKGTGRSRSMMSKILSIATLGMLGGGMAMGKKTPLPKGSNSIRGHYGTGEYHTPRKPTYKGWMRERDRGNRMKFKQKSRT